MPTPTLPRAGGRVAALIATLALAFATFGSSPAQALPLGDPVVCGNTTISSHAAAKYYAPENTVAGINFAGAQLQAGMVEIDIRFSKSNAAYLMHDATIDRTTDGTGNLADFYVSQLGAFNAAAYDPWNVDPNYTGLTAAGKPKAEIPYVYDFLKAVRSNGMRALLDVKVTPTKVQADSLVSYLDRTDINLRQSVLYMGDADNVKAMHGWYPDMHYVVIEYPPTGRIYTPQYVASLGAEYYAVPFDNPAFNKAFVDYFHAAGVKIDTWTSDTPAKDVPTNWQKVYDAGADLLTTNEPAKAAQLCGAGSAKAAKLIGKARPGGS